MTGAPHHYSCWFVTDGVEPGVLRVTHLDIRERMSECAQCEVSLVYHNGHIEPRGLLGKTATIVLTTDQQGVERRFCGVIRTAREVAASNEQRQVIRVQMHSLLSVLDDASDFKIFHNMNAKDVVAQVLKDAGVPDDCVEWRLESEPPVRETCTQYCERTRDFVDRLLQEEAIYWYSMHTEQGPKIVFGDAASGYEVVEHDLPFEWITGVVAGERIHRVAERSAARPAKFTLRDHDFQKPTLDLTAQDEREAPFAREHYEYPGYFTDASTGKRRVEGLSTAHVSAAHRLQVSGSAPKLTAGHVFSIHGSPDARFDGEFITIVVRHTWEAADGTRGATLTSEAELLESSQRFALMPTTARPRAIGALASVVTPSGEEIHPDRHGRVKVQFHADRHASGDDKSSGWVRVSQLHTSGAIAIPRRTWELLVDFEDGNPERPVAFGRLYNAGAPPPDSLPSGKTNSVLMSYSSPGGGGRNEVRLGDSGSGELVTMYAEKDMNLVVANDKSEKVSTSASVGVAVDQSITVGAGQTEKVGAAETLNVGGSQTHKVGASRTKTIGGAEKHEVKGARSVTIGANHTTMTPMSDSLSTTGSLTETVGGMCLEAAALGVGIAVAGSTSISVGAAKIEAVATGKNDMTIGARATTVGGAFVNVTPKDISFNTKGAKVTTVGGAWLGNAGGNAEISSQGDIAITVGGAVLMNSTKIVLKVGGSSVTISGASVVLDSSEVKVTATGLMSELASAIGSK